MAAASTAPGRAPSSRNAGYTGMDGRLCSFAFHRVWTGRGYPPVRLRKRRGTRRDAQRLGTIGGNHRSAVASMIRYTRGPVRLAYMVHGTGEPALVVVPGWMSHLTVDRETPEIRAFHDALNPTGRLLLFDKRGAGHADRPSGPDNYTLDARVDDLLRVMDSAGIGRAALVGWSEGGPIALTFAARFPERVTRLVLYGTFARLTAAPGYPVGVPPANFQALATLGRTSWALGSRVITDLVIPEADTARQAWFTTYLRAIYSPQAAAETFEALADLDVRDCLAAVRVPALVLHRRGDPLVPHRLGRFLAEHLPDARFVPLAGEHHFPYFGDADAVVDEVRRFLGPVALAAAAPALSPREQEVLRLLGAGCTNREIAAALAVSVPTVERHLTHLYGKIGARRRADAVAYAARRGVDARPTPPARD
jgi:pimeloyl-ACP methyl ester carboxylesterase